MADPVPKGGTLSLLDEFSERLSMLIPNATKPVGRFREFVSTKLLIENPSTADESQSEMTSSVSRSLTGSERARRSIRFP